MKTASGDSVISHVKDHWDVSLSMGANRIRDFVELSEWNSTVEQIRYLAKNSCRSFDPAACKRTGKYFLEYDSFKTVLPLHKVKKGLLMTPTGLKRKRNYLCHCGSLKLGVYT